MYMHVPTHMHAVQMWPTENSSAETGERRIHGTHIGTDSVHSCILLLRTYAEGDPFHRSLGCQPCPTGLPVTKGALRSLWSLVPHPKHSFYLPASLA